jgi:uncharacterized phiE125 gp8 family phage protein
MIRPRLLVPPETEPVSLAEAKQFLAITHSLRDDLISRLIKGAREHIETVLNRGLITQEWEWVMDGTPGPGSEPWLVSRQPVQSVDAVEYRAGALWLPLAVGSGFAFTEGDYGIVTRPDLSDWPVADGQTANYRVRATIGYGDADAVPESAKVAILHYVVVNYEMRGVAFATDDKTSVLKTCENLVNSMRWQ